MIPADGQPAGSRAVTAGDDPTSARAHADRTVAPALDVVATMSVELLVALTLWTLVGRVADVLLATGPWLTVFGAVLGWAVGLSIVRRRAATSAPVEQERAPLVEEPNRVERRSSAGSPSESQDAG